MGRIKTLLLLSQLLVWGFIVGALVLSSPVSVSMGGGTIPQPSVEGLGAVPAVPLLIATGIFATTMALTSRFAP